MKKEIGTFIVNGVTYEEIIESNITLLDLLRDRLGLTGTKEGCTGSGNCGSCTVLVDGKPTLSCLTLAWAVREKNILTVEGLAKGTTLHPIQKSFLDKGAVQCGFCTPGMILSAKVLLDEKADIGETDISELDVRKALAGNLCRCTGYVKIIDAVLDAAKR